MVHQLRVSLIVILFFIANHYCFAAEGGLKVRRVDVVFDQSNLPIIGVDGKNISVMRPASPSIKPQRYCDLIQNAVMHVTARGTNSGVPERSASPWQLNFGESLLPVMKMAEEQGELVATWQPNLQKLMAAIVTVRKISRLDIIGNKPAGESLQFISSLLQPLVDKNSNLNQDMGGFQLGIGYKSELKKEH